MPLYKRDGIVYAVHKKVDLLMLRGGSYYGSKQA